MTGRDLSLLRKRGGRSARMNNDAEEEEPLLAQHRHHLPQQQKARPRQDENDPPKALTLLHEVDKAITSGYQLPGHHELQHASADLPKASSTIPLIQQPAEPAQVAPMPTLDGCRQGLLDNNVDAQMTAAPAGQGKRPSFCEPCRQARAAPNYAARVGALLDMLYCSACQEMHAAFFFSESQRKESGLSRKCISHQGYCTVCPHVRVSLADVRDLVQSKDGSHTLRCEDPLCPVLDAKILCEAGPGVGAARDTVSIEWSASLDEDTTGTFWERCLAKLQRLHESCPVVFCPHLQTTPSRLCRLDRFEDCKHLYLPGSRRLLCRVCDAAIYLDSRAEDPELTNCKSGKQAHVPIRLHWQVFIRRHGVAEKLAGWLETLDPDSYGHFADQETKHITWCDERGCATTFEGLQNDDFMILPAVEKFMGSRGDILAQMETLTDSSFNYYFEG
ncbi:hypothetical protein HRG_010087 [Hirsutella rhossiliensis]|uniref:Uncharacterized protein n=1 Tax=Hirsutella rhossiliensis TaxID=111463 RepID=A0A9P8MPH3_9HYPO|nr:uncharacterized protein HRG_10087 [Hirsutella rhossiliensis]KAH0959042.1 hypothetical protein HRG_10087 [Hirsutella rhossiliensis]